MQLLGYPLAATQADLTMKQQAFLLVAMPKMMQRQQGGQSEPATTAATLKQQIELRRAEQRRLVNQS